MIERSHEEACQRDIEVFEDSNYANKNRCSDRYFNEFLGRFNVQPFNGGKIDNGVADGRQEPAVEARIVAPKGGVGVNGGNRSENLGGENCENTPVDHLYGLGCLSSK